MPVRPCSCRDGDTCESPGANEIFNCLGCADCDCLTLEEKRELVNLFPDCPCGSCKHQNVQGMDCYDCGSVWGNWEPKE